MNEPQSPRSTEGHEEARAMPMAVRTVGRALFAALGFLATWALVSSVALIGIVPFVRLGSGFLLSLVLVSTAAAVALLAVAILLRTLRSASAAP